MAFIVKIIGAAVPTPHDGRYLVAWNSDTRFGDLHVTSTEDKRGAKTFSRVADALDEWSRVSTVEPKRPDGHPNRPLSALTVEFEPADG